MVNGVVWDDEYITRSHLKKDVTDEKNTFSAMDIDNFVEIVYMIRKLVLWILAAFKCKGKRKQRI